MTRCEKLFACFLSCFFNLSVYSQDLKKATVDYFTGNHYYFDNTLISNEKIKSLEKHQYNYNYDTVTYDFLLEKHLFNKNGNPEYVLTKPIGSEKREVYFEYDTDGNLIKEETHGISPQLNYKIIESFEWSYNQGILLRQRRYIMTDEIPVEKGAYGFQEKIFLFSNDTILYNYTDTFIQLISNNVEQCKDISVSLYPPSFKSVINTTLKFHSNNKLYSKTVKRDTIIQSNIYDICGKEISEKKPNSRCLKLLENKTQCLPRETIRICNESDTVTLNNQLVYFIRNEGSYFQHDSGPGSVITNRGISYYNSDFKIIQSIDTTTYSRGSMGGTNQFSATKTVRINTYEYFANGLLKKIIGKNENGKLIDVVEFKIEYYE
nr:hypothetical protein [Bacteroidota bacterium]